MRFEGVVNSVKTKYADCMLYDLDDPSQPIEFAAIALSKFPEPVYEGVAFQWSIKDGDSKITINKAPLRSEEEQRDIEQKAEKLAKLLGVNYG